MENVYPVYRVYCCIRVYDIIYCYIYTLVFLGGMGQKWSNLSKWNLGRSGFSLRSLRQQYFNFHKSQGLHGISLRIFALYMRESLKVCEEGECFTAMFNKNPTSAAQQSSSFQAEWCIILIAYLCLLALKLIHFSPQTFMSAGEKKLGTSFSLPNLSASWRPTFHVKRKVTDRLR